MRTLNFTQPYTDDVLTWNSSLQQYELTPQFVKSNLDIHFADDDILAKRIKKNSRKVYKYIKYRAFSGNVPYINTLLNQTLEGREFILQVLLEQLDADNETGFNDLSSQPAIDMASGREINRESLFANQISVDTEQLIDTNNEYFGFNIMVQYAYPPMIRLYLERVSK